MEKESEPLELRHLESFCAVASGMHVTRAAERLHIAQPALTQQIRLLEKELGLSLVRRTGRGIALTEAGEFFHKEAELILQHVKRACLQTREIVHGNLNRVVVGVTEAAAFSPVLAAVFSRCLAKWPAVQLVLCQKQANELVAALEEKLIDAAFTCDISDANPALSSQELALDRMLLAVPAVHPFAQRAAVSLPDLKDEPLILVAHDQFVSAFEENLRAGCRTYGFAPRIIQTNPKLMLALNLVAAEVGLAFVPDYMSGVPLDALCYVPIQDPFPLLVETTFVTRTGDASPLIADLRNIAVQAFTQANRMYGKQVRAKVFPEAWTPSQEAEREPLGSN